MGAWGYYDNENDDTLDEFANFRQFFIQKYNKQLLNKYNNYKEECKKEKKPGYNDLYEDEMDIYIKNNIVKAAKHLVTYINKLNKSSFSLYGFSKFDNRSSIITGLIIRLLYFLQPVKKKFALPTKLFDEFPLSLKKTACSNIKKSMQNVENEFWNNSKKRIEALQKEEKLFECNNSNTKAKAKTRKSPEESATKFNVGYKKKGNDGNLWIITTDKNQVKRWKKL